MSSVAVNIGQRRPGWIGLAAIAGLLLFLTGGAAAQATPSRGGFIAVGERVSTPFGWMDMCGRIKSECETPELPAVDIALSAPQAWRALERINRQVNAALIPATDEETSGVIDHWSYGVDKRGDCEDFALLKRLRLMQAGFPRQALLMTVVKDNLGAGHAVLTVKTDLGEFILDNRRDEILSWEQTGYRFIKRQSPANPNVWVEIGAPRRAVLSRREAR